MKENKFCALLCSDAINKRDTEGKFVLQPLPYPQNQLEPYMSERTVSFHYGKHLAGYIDKTNQLKANTDMEDGCIQDIVRGSTGPLYNNASQVFNHYFFFEQLREGRSVNKPDGKIADSIVRDYGSFEHFQEVFSQSANTLFGSGYVWLLQNGAGKLEILQMHNGDSPMREGKRPLMNIDVWEHAYYLDVQNKRAVYVENFWKIINWDVVNKRHTPPCCG